VTTTDSPTELDDFFWSDLLDYIDDGRVIPVVDSAQLGPGDGGERLETMLACRLAQRLRIDVSDIRRPPRLDDVVSRHLRTPGSAKGVLYGRTLQILKELGVEPGQALRDLAAIRGFELFVSMSCDPLLQRAIDEVRHGGEARCESIAYAPNRIADIEVPRARMTRPAVFHLFGRLSTAPDSVICDEDRLEFLHALQDDALRPKLLFDELRDSHLLLLGCQWPDWAVRFFLRTVKNERLSMRQSETFEYLVGPEVASDPELAAFLADFSRATQLVPWRGEDFVHELRRRWEERHPVAGTDRPPTVARGDRLTAGAVFISYSRRDFEAARRLAHAFEAAGIDTWFDKDQLEAGDDWELSIRRGVKASTLFVPIISADTQAPERRRSFFWTEWNAADDRADGMAPGEPFIVPVAIDGTQPYSADVPKNFNKRQWAILPGGEPTPEFVETVKLLYREVSERANRVKAA
jgi:hypothetical protein